MSTANILPDSRAKEAKGRIFVGSQSWVPVFCANCGKEGGRCPEENMTFMFYLCQSCFESKGHITATMVMPDEVFWAKVKDAQIEKYGRVRTAEEVHAALQDESSLESKLVRS